MSDPANFVARWARRKRDVAEAEKAAAQTPDTAQTAARTDDANAASSPRVPAKDSQPPAPDEPPFDPASLPPIDSITAETDIRAFLAPGVPAELRHAALRRAWSADPAIRDFVGLVENGWDFNDPASIGGFGALESTADLARDVARIVGDLAADPEEPGPEPQLSDPSRQSEPGAAVPASGTAVEPGRKPDDAEVKPPQADDLAGGREGYSAPQQETKVPESLQLLASAAVTAALYPNSARKFLHS